MKVRTAYPSKKFPRTVPTDTLNACLHLIFRDLSYLPRAVPELLERWVSRLDQFVVCALLKAEDNL